MQFCIRDDDTSFFTSPEELERAYGELSRRGPISLGIVPFCRAGLSGGVPAAQRGRWTTHPLHLNEPLVEYLRRAIREGRFEPMLHGYHHDRPDGTPEFSGGPDLMQKVAEGRRYLERVLDAPIRVFVPPHNTIGRDGLRALAAEHLHLAGTAGMRVGWSLTSPRAWATWARVRRWRRAGGCGIPWVLDLGDHRELPGTPVTPVSWLPRNAAALQTALTRGGVFCAATHYWELNAPSVHPGHGTVVAQLLDLVNSAVAQPRVAWRSVGEVVCGSPERA